MAQGIKTQYIPVGYYNRAEVIELIGEQATRRQPIDGKIINLPFYYKPTIDAIVAERRKEALEKWR